MNDYRITYRLNGRVSRVVLRARSEEEACEDLVHATTHPINPDYKGAEILQVEKQ